MDNKEKLERIRAVLESMEDTESRGDIYYELSKAGFSGFEDVVELLDQVIFDLYP